MNRQQFPLYLSPPHPCAYLQDRSSQIIFLDPLADIDPAMYGELANHGFRRSGGNIYRPGCSGCDACVPLRIPCTRFQPRRAQRRVWRDSSELQVVEKQAGFDAEHFQLYRRYIDTRHPDGGMATSSEDQYMQFLACDWADTRFFEIRRDRRLVAVAVTDLLPQGLSAVYTFYEPALQRLSPGVFAVLWQIEEAKRRRLPWLYLGFWIAGCAKMEYKSQYRPLQAYLQGRWQEFDVAETIAARP